MGRWETSESTTEDLKPKTEGGSSIGSGNWPTAKKRASSPKDQMSEANECLTPINRSGLCTRTALLCHLLHLVYTTLAPTQPSKRQHGKTADSTERRTERDTAERCLGQQVEEGQAKTHQARRSDAAELSSAHQIARLAMRRGSRRESVRRQNSPA